MAKFTEEDILMRRINLSSSVNLAISFIQNRMQNYTKRMIFEKIKEIELHERL